MQKKQVRPHRSINVSGVSYLGLSLIYKFAVNQIVTSFSIHTGGLRVVCVIQYRNRKTERGGLGPGVHACTILLVFPFDSRIVASWFHSSHVKSSKVMATDQRRIQMQVLKDQNDKMLWKIFISSTNANDVLLFHIHFRKRYSSKLVHPFAL